MQLCLDMRTSAGCGTENLNHAHHCSKCGKPLRFALTLHDPKTQVGHYRIVRVIGYGAYGAVYEAIEGDERQASPLTRFFSRYLLGKTPPDKSVGRVALKESFDASSISSFAREFSLLKGLQHPNLPRYLDMFEAQGNGYLVMEYVAGQSLQDILDASATLLPQSQVLGYALQLCDVLEYLHSQQPPILHRDIKPANIRLTPEGRIKLVDFGLLKQAGYQTRATIRGLGTPAYAPMEQYGDNQQVTDVRSDIYSLGATLYHLLSGQEPLSAPNRLAGEHDLLPPLPVTLSSAVREAVTKAMSLMLRGRFASISHVRSALAGGEFDSAPPKVRRRVAASQQKPLNYIEAVDDLSLPHLILQTGGHVLSVRYSADGQYLYCMTNDSHFLTWRVADGQLQGTLSLAGKESCKRIAISPDGQTVAGAGDDLAVRLWRTSDGQLLHKLGGDTQPIKSLAYTPDGQILASTGGEDKSVRLWQVESGQLLHHLQSKDRLVCLRFSPTGRVLACGSIHRVQLYRMMDRRWLPEVEEGCYQSEQNMSWSFDERFLFCGDHNDVYLWDLAKQKVVKTFKGHNHFIKAVAFAPDGQTMASGSADKTVRIWSFLEPPLRYFCRGHKDDVRCLAYAPNGQTLASGSEDGTVRLWQLQKEVEEAYERPVTSKEVPLFNVRRAQSALLPSQNTESITRNLLPNDSKQLIQPRNKQGLPHLRCSVSGNVLNLAASPDGQTIVSMTDKGEITKWRLADGTAVESYSLNTPNELLSLAISPDGQLIASATDDLIVSLWRLSDGQRLHQLRGHTGLVNVLAISPDGHLLASGSYDDETIRLWRIADGQLLHVLTQNSSIFNVTFSPTGQLLASGNAVSMKWWRVADGKLQQKIGSGSSNKDGIRWSFDGKMLVHGDHNEIQLVRASDGQQIKRFKGHNHVVTAVAWHPNGQMVASSGPHDNIRLFSLKKPHLRHVCQGHKYNATCLAFSPDGRVLASGGEDETVRLWQLDAP